MAAKQISIIPRTRFTFPQLGPSTGIDFATRKLEGVADAASGALLVRQYSITMASAGSAFVVRLYTIMIGPEDPKTILIGPVLAEVSLPPDTSTTPILYLADLATLGVPIPTMVRPALRFQTGGPGGACEIELSADLLLRDNK